MINVEESAHFKWLSAVSPEASELKSEMDKLGVPPKFINYMLDAREQPRADYERVAEFGVLVVRGLTDNSHGKITSPVFIGFNRSLLITVCHDSEQNRVIKELPQQDNITDLIFQILNSLISPFFDKLEELSNLAERIETRRGNVSNQRLDELSNLKQNLVYLRAATTGNSLAIDELDDMVTADTNFPMASNSEVIQRVADLKVEYNQCQHGYEIVSNVASEFESTFGNMLNNRLNKTMQFLTVWSLLLAIPTIVSGFYGMNVKLPLATQPTAWVITLVITFGLMLIMYVYLRKNNKL
ncbi:magnesium transporter CorA family protein [Lentilactobacillus sp. Marseille-Q4993]|uniref:magnesium transporter CorA family protein n=1 Tax=Lentilactobacillus sp. Marseille-Q4993 TaxID=3039492 RepID=UPI0024BCE2C0|nr:magnesium transporter CorA family protein [Lentilactobacillus sp. Marseille-Q4993]